jgi:hypothetical protein
VSGKNTDPDIPYNQNISQWWNISEINANQPKYDGCTSGGAANANCYTSVWYPLAHPLYKKIH